MDMARRVRQKLGLSQDELEALFGAVPHPVRGGPDGRKVAAEIRRRFGLPSHLPLGEALQSRACLPRPRPPGSTTPTEPPDELWDEKQAVATPA